MPIPPRGFRRPGSDGGRRRRGLTRHKSRTEGSFRIRAALAPVVTADTSYVNPFLHTKLRENKKEGALPRVLPQGRLNRHRRSIVDVFVCPLPSRSARSVVLKDSSSTESVAPRRLRKPFVIAHICCAWDPKRTYADVERFAVIQ